MSAPQLDERTRELVAVGAAFSASCTFPNAVEIRHLMDASITVGKGAQFSYAERHVHGPRGGGVVVPKTRVRLLDGARFHTDFELIRGHAGTVDIDYAVDSGNFDWTVDKKKTIGYIPKYKKI